MATRNDALIDPATSIVAARPHRPSCNRPPRNPDRPNMPKLGALEFSAFHRSRHVAGKTWLRRCAYGDFRIARAPALLRPSRVHAAALVHAWPPRDPSEFLVDDSLALQSRIHRSKATGRGRRMGIRRPLIADNVGSMYARLTASFSLSG